VELHIDDLRFRYPGGEFQLEIDALRVGSGESIAIVGPSGCGKSTLLLLLAGLLLAEHGSVRVGGELLNTLSDEERRAFRIRHLGFVFQDFALLDYLNVRDNLLLPGRLNPARPLDEQLAARATELAGRAGVGHLLARPMRALSQGERQRVAICRALVTGPKFVLADEPTGNLDPSNKERIFELLRQEAREAGATLAVVTHDHAFLDRFDRVLTLQDHLHPRSS
jgi:putative ABC transport system ATP-binding protein